jgi:hypothetical protein
MILTAHKLLQLSVDSYELLSSSFCSTLYANLAILTTPNPPTAVRDAITLANLLVAFDRIIRYNLYDIEPVFFNSLLLFWLTYPGIWLLLLPNMWLTR